MADFAASDELRKLLETLKDPLFEDCMPYMYVDTRKKITVGVGHNLTIHQDQTTLPFIVKRFARKAVKGGDQGIPIKEPKTLDRAASADEIKNDYDFLHKHDGLGKYLPKQLRDYTTLELPSEDVDKLFRKDCDDAIKIAIKKFPDLGSYPVECQAAIIDIAFNVGNFGTFEENFVPAINGKGKFAGKSAKERWTAAAQVSSRGAVAEVRNNQIYQWLMVGANTATAGQ